MTLTVVLYSSHNRKEINKTENRWQMRLKDNREHNIQQKEQYAAMNIEVTINKISNVFWWKRYDDRGIRIDFLVIGRRFCWGKKMHFWWQSSGRDTACLRSITNLRCTQSVAYSIYYSKYIGHIRISLCHQLTFAIHCMILFLPTSLRTFSTYNIHPYIIHTVKLLANSWPANQNIHHRYRFSTQNWN